MRANVGAGLLAKRPVHPTQILRLECRFREQARSHRDSGVNSIVIGFLLIIFVLLDVWCFKSRYLSDIK
jgi:hypothetical protein